MFGLGRGLLAAMLVTAALASAGPVFAQAVPGEEHCVVNVKASDMLNIRAKGSAQSKVVGTLRYGQCGVVVMAECQGSWCPIEDGHRAGWVNSRFISMVSPSLYCVANVGAGDVLNLRAYPSPGSRVLAQLKRNQCDIAFLPYSTGGWQKVRVNGYEGWVNRRFVSGQ